MNYRSISLVKDGVYKDYVKLVVQGCNLYCKNCNHHEYRDFYDGLIFNSSSFRDLDSYMRLSNVNGLIICGGDVFDFANISEVLFIICHVKYEFNKRVVIFTGHYWRELESKLSLVDLEGLINNVDFIVTTRSDKVLSITCLKDYVVGNGFSYTCDVLI